MAKRPWIDIAKIHKEWKCEICGRTEEDMKLAGYSRYSLHVHHKDMLSSDHPDYHKNNDIENLQVLCFACHNSIHSSKRMKENNPMKDKEVRRKASMSKAWSKDSKRKVAEGASKYWKGRKRSDDNRKNLSLSKLGRKYYNNGSTCKMFVPGSQPDGWVLGRSFRKI